METIKDEMQNKHFEVYFEEEFEESRAEFEDETTSHERGLMLFVNATCDISSDPKNKFHLCHVTSLMFLLCDSHKMFWIYCFRCKQACNSRHIYDQVERNVHRQIDSNTSIPQ